MASNNKIQNFQGSWNYISGDNFDGILKELGVNKVIRTIAKTVKPRLTINEKNGKWLFKSESTFKTTSFEFTPGVEFDDLSPTGDQLKVIIRFDENGKWIETVNDKDGKQLFLERWINDQDQLQVIMECGKTKATQLFRRIN